MVFVVGDCLVPASNPSDVLMMVGPEIRWPRPKDVVSFFLDGDRQIKKVDERDGQPVLVSDHGEVTPLAQVVIEGVMVDCYQRK